MRHQFINQEGNSRLILIFAGWGSDPVLYEDIQRRGWDTLVVWDYRDPTFPFELLNDYTTVYVYAWSMGVWAAEPVLSRISPTAAFAVNGTASPRSDAEGIPKAVYDGTLETLSERNLLKFRLRMAGDRERAAQLEELLPHSDIEELREELDVIRRTGAHSEESTLWTRAYIGRGDRIFPPSAQNVHWKRRGTEIIEATLPHYWPLAAIVAATIADPGKVGEHFRQATATYDSHADAQRLIADRLTSIIGSVIDPVAVSGTSRRSLEIGSGTGLLTRLYGPLLHPSEATFVDLYPLPRYHIAPCEHYVTADAEEWIDTMARQTAAGNADRWDWLLTASVIQWFANQERFFRNAAEVILPGGSLFAATFTRGNLHELDAVRPSPLVYRTADELTSMASRYFSEVNTWEEEIRLRFPGVREALLHIKHTGTAGSGEAVGVHRLLDGLHREADGSTSLTYKVLYIHAAR